MVAENMKTTSMAFFSNNPGESITEDGTVNNRKTGIGLGIQYYSHAISWVLIQKYKLSTLTGG